MGWSSLLYPSERPNFCYEGSYNLAPNITVHKENFPFPVFENDLYAYLWEWIDDDWSLELEYQNQRLTMDGYISIVIGEMEESETDSVDTLVLESGLEEPH